jgi:hypothetical protein
MTSGIRARIYAKYHYDYTLIIEDNRRSLRLIENVFLMIISDYKPLSMAINIKYTSGGRFHFLYILKDVWRRALNFD